MNTPILEQEMVQLNAQIEHIRKNREVLEGELRVVETELDKFSAARQRFDALREVCEALEKLGQLKAAELFWQGIPEVKDTSGHLGVVRSRVSRFEEKIDVIVEKQTALKEQILRREYELDDLCEEVRDAQEREERRLEEFVVEREITPLPYRAMVMPWTKEAEGEKRFKRSMLVALCLCFLFGFMIARVVVPIPDRAVAMVDIPDRLAMLVKSQPPIPAQVPKPEPKKAVDETKTKSAPEKPESNPKGGAPVPVPDIAKAVNPGGGGGGNLPPSARQKAEAVGVLAFKNTFQDLMKETPVARLGTEARLDKVSNMGAGQATAQRSLVAMQAGSGNSGGIGNYGFSRNIGGGSGSGGGIGIGVGSGSGGGRGNGIGDGIGNGTGPGRVASSIVGAGEGKPRPLSDGLGAGRTDEEIQIVFDRYKASLYRIYNTELRKDPTLRGKMLLRICIESGGEVSMCKVESTDLASPVLVAQIVDRILRFNFGPKDGVSKTTILYPIDFLPAG